MPPEPSNSYFVSMATRGIRRRWAARASRARVNSFSFTSSCWRAVSHSSGDTIWGAFMTDSSQGSIVSWIAPGWLLDAGDVQGVRMFGLGVHE